MSTNRPFSSDVSIDESVQTYICNKFKDLDTQFDNIFDPQISKEDNGAINMGPTFPL